MFYAGQHFQLFALPILSNHNTFTLVLLMLQLRCFLLTTCLLHTTGTAVVCRAGCSLQECNPKPRATGTLISRRPLLTRSFPLPQSSATSCRFRPQSIEVRLEPSHKSHKTRPRGKQRGTSSSTVPASGLRCGREQR